MAEYPLERVPSSPYCTYFSTWLMGSAVKVQCLTQEYNIMTLLLLDLLSSDFKSSPSYESLDHKIIYSINVTYIQYFVRGAVGVQCLVQEHNTVTLFFTPARSLVL